MAETKKNNQRILYFSNQLKTVFNSFLKYPCTVVEAPMGYGKTTAVNEAMNRLEAEIVWQKIYDRSASEFWAGFCQAIAQVDKECAKGLQNIGMLEDSLMKRELMKLLDGLKLTKETILIIDDYHFVKSDAADDFLRLLILNMPEKLHLIIITRVAFLGGSSELKLKGLLNYIGTKTLEFSKQDIKNYFNLHSIILNNEELEQLYVYSEGWVSALYLCMLDYKLHGSFVFTRNVPELVYQTVFEPLDYEMRDFLMALCIFDAFTLEQAKEVWQGANAKELLDRMLTENAFITKDYITGSYSMHNILNMCVKEQFRQLPEEIQKAIWGKAGKVYSKNKQYRHAMECFYKAQYFEGVLEAMEGGDKARSFHNEHKDLLICCYQDCPFEVKKKYPLAILFFALEFVTQFREPELFMKACHDFHQCLAENTDLTNDEREQLLGEYEVLQTFTVYNDLIKMSECNAKAAKLLKAPARFINTKNSFMFSSPSVLYLYYRESGKLAELIDFIRMAPSYYAQNTKGHGQSFRPVMEAEWQYYCGDFKNAEITVHRAIPMAKESGQRDVELAGLFLLAKLALQRGEFSEVCELLEQMETLVRHEIKHYQTYWLVYTLDLCRAYIYTSLERTEQIPDWIFEYEYPKHIHFLSIAYANMIYGKALLLKGDNVRLLGLSESFQRQASIFPNLFAIVCTQIYAAIANYRLGRTDEADLVLRHALDTAMPDNLLMPFVENAKGLLGAFDKLAEEENYASFIKKIKFAYEKYDLAVQKITNIHFNDKIPKLTAREQQIALLVLEGLNNKEIAAQLYISANTVKVELKNIFKKLNINSRVLLTKEMIS